jgi:hypothetical protein
MEGDVIDSGGGDEGGMLESVADNAGASSAAVAEISTELGSTTEPSAVVELQGALETKVTETNTKIGESLSLDSDFGKNTAFTEDVINDSCLETPETEDGKKLKSFTDAVGKKLNAGVEVLQEKYGESGKALKDSPKTMGEIFDKYGKYILIIALAIAGLIALNEMGESMSGCYQIATLSSQTSTPKKVGCSHSTVPNQSFIQCSCQGVRATQCAFPECGGNDGINYYWQKVSALQVLAHMPGMLASDLLNPLTNSSTELIKTIAIYGGIFLIIVIIGYVIMKKMQKQHK